MRYLVNPTTGELKEENAAVSLDIIAPEEETAVASRAYAEGEQFILKGKLYAATAAIASGASIVTEGASANAEEAPNVINQIENHTPAVMTGATANADGTAGLAPQPHAGDEDKVLQGKGVWGKKLKFDTDIQNGKYGYINANNEFIPFMSQADLSNVTGTLSIENGGTGATSAAAARTNLGLATVASSGSYADLSNKPTIPSNTNQLTNGAGFTTATGHNHGLLHNDLTVTLANTSTDSGWSMINSSYNGFLLKTIRTNASAPNWIENGYAAGIAFGGADTKGVLSLAYGSPGIRFAGGNGTGPTWWIRCTGTSGKTYDLNSPITNISRNGTTFTATRANGTTFTFTQQDNNTTYGNGNASTFGLVKLSDTYSGTANTSAKAANSIAASQWALQTAYANRNAPDSSSIATSGTNHISWVKIGRVCIGVVHFKWTGSEITLTTSAPKTAEYIWLVPSCYSYTDGSTGHVSIEINGTTIKVSSWKSTNMTTNHEYSALFHYITAS